MLHQKIDLLMNALSVRSADLARLTKHSPTTFSRLRQGSRVPKSDSPTMQSLVEGIVSFSRATNQMKKLSILIACKPTQSLEAAIVEWLYSDQIPQSRDASAYGTAEFGKRLDTLMALAQMSNRTLSLASDIEYSYISRLHRGERFPKFGSASLRRICEVTYDKIEQNGALPALSQQTTIPLKFLCASAIRDWLCGFDDNNAIVSAQKLIEKIETMDETPQPFSTEAVLSEPMISDYYVGDSGLQNAIIRFLSGVKEGQEIWLYSDHPMHWMTDRFQIQWAILMRRCLQRNNTIRIIHNIDRNVPEMLAAIQNWLPLYMSGLIVPFYNQKQNGERFHHTLFLCPDNAAVSGVSPDGAECEFAYVTDSARLQRLEAAFTMLLKDCQPLLSVCSTPQYMDGDALFRRFGTAEVFADDHSVIVNKVSAPSVSFRLYHPNIVATFKLFLK